MALASRSVALVAALACTSPVAAQSPFSDPAALFAAADRDRDGLVSRSEFIVARARSFDLIDANRDGLLTVTELTAVASGQIERMAVRLGFGRFDQNRDGRLTRAEFDEGPRLAFDRVDTDRNGLATADEIAKVRPTS